MSMLSRVAPCLGSAAAIARAKSLGRVLAASAVLCASLWSAPWAATAIAARAPDKAGAIEAASKVNERFYLVEMMGGRAGWMHAKETTAPDGSITTDSVVAFSLKRGPVSIDVRIESQFVETADGKPVSMRSFQQMAKIPMETTYQFTPEGVRVRTMQGAAEPI